MTRQGNNPGSGPLVELSVERLGAQGDGIAQYRGEPVFLPFTVPGDRVRARLGTRRGGGRAGQAVERLASGPGRAAAPCRHFGDCGGCMLQHIEPGLYREIKLDALRAALERVGIDPAVSGRLQTVPPARRRARLGVMQPKNPGLPLQIGFRRRYRHDLVDMAECLVLEAPLFATVGRLRLIGDDLLPPGAMAEMTLTLAEAGVDLLIEATEPPPLGALESLARFAAEADLARIVWRTPDREIPVVEHRPVRVLLSGVAVPFPPGAFLQASRSAEAILVEEVLSGVASRRPVLDLFAGLGTFSFALARAGHVHAVEGDPRAVAALAEAAAGEGRVTVERRDLVRHPFPPEALCRYAAAVFDPPRAGALGQAGALAASALETVVAVSCNPATFARDAAKLVDGGFRIERVTPIDQFVWTPHLEIAAVFRR